MGGDVKRTVRAIATPVTAPFEATARILTGENVGEAIGKSIKPGVEGAMSIVGGFERGLVGDQPSPSLPDVGTGMTVEERERLRREQEISILRDRPGRSATILSR